MRRGNCWRRAGMCPPAVRRVPRVVTGLERWWCASPTRPTLLRPLPEKTKLPPPQTEDGSLGNSLVHVGCYMDASSSAWQVHEGALSAVTLAPAATPLLQHFPSVKNALAQQVKLKYPIYAFF